MSYLLGLNASNVFKYSKLITHHEVIDLPPSPTLQIEPIHIDFGRFSFQTGEMSMRHTYPPSFTIVIDGHRAIQESFVTFEFKGILPTHLVYEVPLTQGSLHYPIGRSKCISILCLTRHVKMF